MHQGDRGALAFRQAGQRGLDPARDLGALLFGRRSRRGIGHVRRAFTAVAAMFAQSVDTQVMRDAMQPGADPRLGAPFPGLAPEPQEGLLRHILGLGGIAQHAPGESMDAAQIRIHKQTAGRRIAGTNARDKRGVGLDGVRICIPVRRHKRS